MRWICKFSNSLACFKIMVSFPLILQKRLKFLSQVEGSVQFIDERFPTCYACYRIFRALYEISRLEINFSAIMRACPLPYIGEGIVPKPTPSRKYGTVAVGFYLDWNRWFILVSNYLNVLGVAPLQKVQPIYCSGVSIFQNIYWKDVNPRSPPLLQVRPWYFCSGL